MANNFNLNNDSLDTNKIGCSSNRTHLIDPNRFDGQNSSNNISVPLEDLSISVELTTFKKGRSVLTAEYGKVGTAQSVDTVTINFLEGSNINGEKVLTTKYTDLTTVFDKDAERNNETLGISSIDIEFNSSMTPMIVIKFIDVRGSSIFQNEEEISGDKSKNKFGVFFQIPYPLFELTIKGYYGQPVKYCLHMWKFNSKFNSQTGNFEITANFVGYTYAMFNDMILGYLRAIPYTKIGKERYKLINDERTSLGLDEIRNLDDLMIAISNINKGITKLGAEDENAMVITNNEGKGDQINKVEDIVNQLGIGIDVRHEKNEGRFKYIIFDENLSQVKADELKTKYINDVKIQIEEFNKNSTLSLDYGKFSDFSGNKNLYTGISKNLLNSNNSSDKKILQQKLQITNEVELAAKILDMSKYFRGLTISDTSPYYVYDLTSIYGFIDEVRNNLNNLTKDAKEKLALTIKQNIKGEIGLDPTVRNIIEIFTTAVEVFMETIWSVSSAAEDLQNTLRPTQLLEKFITEKNTDINQEDLNIKKFWPWPSYLEQSEEEGRATYVDRYLGEANVLTNPKDVNELAFIDDLLAAFIYSQKRREEAIANIDSIETNWIPVNPMDTRALGVTNTPYSRIGEKGFTDNKEVLSLSLTRAMTFLAHTNFCLTDDEVEKMAEIEATAALKTLQDDMIRKSLGSITLSDIKKLTNKYKIGVSATSATTFNMLSIENIDNVSSVVFTDDILPINKGFGGDNIRYWRDVSDNNIIKLNINEETQIDNIFLGSLNNTNIIPIYDGGYYVKILDKKTFEENQKELNFNGVTADTTSKLIFENLKELINTKEKAKAAGYNVFGGPYGVQEFSQMDFGIEGLTDLKYSFYRQASTVGLATRDVSKPLVKNNWDYGTFDAQNPTTTIVYQQSGIYDAIDAVQAIIGKNAEYGRFDNNYENIGKNWECFKNLSTNNVTYPFIDYAYYKNSDDKTSSRVFSLFGSRWFYGQSQSTYPIYAKAMLFLNSLPFTEYGESTLNQLFRVRGGFIHAPKLWAAYIGSLIWRNDFSKPIFDDNNRIVGGGSGPKDPIIFRKPNNTIEGIYTPWVNSAFSVYKSPTRDCYIRINKTMTINDSYFLIDNSITNLPAQAQDEFKRIFFDFVISATGNYDFKSLNEEIQIVENGTIQKFESAYNATKTAYESVDYYKRGRIPISVIQNNFINIDKYKVFLPIMGEEETPLQIALELKQGYISLDDKGTETPVKHLIDMMIDEVIIANANPHTWEHIDNNVIKNAGDYYPIYCSEAKFDLYYNKLLKVWSDNMSSAAERELKKNIEQEIFGTADENIIKLELYNHCKAVNDKWLAGAKDIDKLLFQCGNGDKNSIDLNLAKKYRPGTNKSRLIDSFRFVTRSFADIGDKLYINPMPVASYLIDNPNSTFYDCVGNLLGSNSFDFIAMPSYINYNNPEELATVFKPMSYNEAAISSGRCGPSFVCVYVGKASNHLDGVSQYPNDGFDVKCDNDGNLIGLPKDFANSSNDYENDVAIFAVNFSQQNQNIFKDITLDQSEFPETSETLQITDEIAKKGGENNRTLVGQNIYNVHRLRSYKAEVQMLGNAMIQPMMHFQLNNIPMFHGAYLITKAKHSIVPNHMSTTFEGVRIRYAETKLITASDLYMSLLDALDLTNTPSGASNGSLGGSFPPIVMTIKENGGVNGKLVSGNIKTAKLIIPKEIKNRVGLYKGEDENLMIAEAVPPLNAMLTAWVKYLKDNGFSKNSENTYAYINSAFRTIQDQEDKAKSNPKASAKPQTSNHGWGIAVDFQFFKKDGSIIYNYQDGKPNVGIGYNYIQNPGLKWLVEHSHDYGFIIPEGLRNNTGLEEFWHFEYHGNAAKCILSKSNIIKGVTVNTSTPYHSSVVNPKSKDGKTPDYSKNCDYISVGPDGTDGVGCPAVGKVGFKSKISSYKSSVNKLLAGDYSNCGEKRDCKGSMEGLKTVPALFTNNKLTKKGVFAVTQGLIEGFGSSPSRKNPGNIRKGKGFQNYGSWAEGWKAYADKYLGTWINGQVVAAASSKYSSCYVDDSNKTFTSNSIAFTTAGNYDYKYDGSSPTLRQFVNIYAPWGDSNNPTNYIGELAVTMKDFGHNINVDAKMNTWLT